MHNSFMAGRRGGVTYPTMLELFDVEREFFDWIYDARAQSRDTLIFRSKSGAELLDVEVKVQFTQRYFDNGELSELPPRG